MIKTTIVVKVYLNMRQYITLAKNVELSCKPNAGDGVELTSKLSMSVDHVLVGKKGIIIRGSMLPNNPETKEALLREGFQEL